MNSGIKLIVGLGNPGLQYEKTRHNVGFWFVKSVAEQYHGAFKLESKFRSFLTRVNIADQKCELLLPETFMNLSGDAVGRFLRFYKFDPESILVVHDELDFDPGIVRLKKAGGANGHNGVQNIIDHVGSNDFWRMRIGIGKPVIKEDVANYVLCSFRKEEFEQVSGSIDRALAIVPDLVSGDFEKAMSQLHLA